ncbi:hypothetical protein HDU81_009813 [Chytriomyces hyalinus]|nr:hypothetical protein HDU81_009813 [Chytriomyces hyalinus]
MLSPLLFNCHIHGLSIQLRAPGIPRIRINSIQLNNLLFADDTALVGANQHDLAVLLCMCEEWSNTVGIRFSPSKCIYLRPTPAMHDVPLKLYNTDLPSSETAPYLGIPFGQHGINWALLAKERTAKARGIIVALPLVGMNAMGWAPAASVNIYRSFIWPVLEYGIALKLPSVSTLKLYESVQRLALQTLTSTPCNTSTAALHKLLQVEPFKHCATELNLMWSACLHNSTDRSIPAIQFWRGALLGIDKPFQECLPCLPRSNPLVTHEDAKWIDFRQQPLVPPPLAEVPFKYPPKPQRALANTVRKKLRKESIVNLDNNPDTIAGAIQVEMDDPIQPYLTACKGIDHKTRNNILRWTLGAVTRHEPCLKCADVLTRSHTADCSGATALLCANHATLAPPIGRMTWLDAVLNDARNTPPAEIESYNDVSAAVALIYTKCRHLQQQANGYWAEPDAPARPLPPRRPPNRIPWPGGIHLDDPAETPSLDNQLPSLAEHQYSIKSTDHLFS